MLAVLVVALAARALAGTLQDWSPQGPTVGAKLAALVEGLGPRGRASRWPWVSARLPPESFYDCLYLYFSCTDYHGQGDHSIHKV